MRPHSVSIQQLATTAPPTTAIGVRREMTSRGGQPGSGCVGALMTLCAATELSRHIRRITPFTHDIFACFVCSIYVVDGVRGVFGRFGGRPSQFGEALFASNRSLFTFGAGCDYGSRNNPGTSLINTSRLAASAMAA